MNKTDKGKCENLIQQGLDILSVFENTGDRRGFIAWLDQSNSVKKDINKKSKKENRYE